MTTTIVYGDAVDGTISSTNASYTTARNGGTLSATTNASTLFWGQYLSGGSYTCLQAFLQFTYSVVSTDTIVSATLNVVPATNMSQATSRDLIAAEYDWGGSLTTTDWRTGSQLSALTRMATMVNASSGPDVALAGSDALVSRIGSAGPLRVVCFSSRTLAGSTPAGDEGSSFDSADASGLSTDPWLEWESLPTNRLAGVMGAQVQLSDGTHAYIEDATVTTPNVSVKHRNASGTVTTVASLGMPSGGAGTYAYDNRAAQEMALVADSSDNLYVIGQAYGFTNAIAAQGFVKGVGHTWSTVPARWGSLPSYTNGRVNNIAAAWHNVGTNGTIMAVISHAAGNTPNTTGDIAYALLDCQHLLGAAGSLLRGSGAARGVVVGGYPLYSDEAPYNPTGSLLDVAAAPGTSNRGYMYGATTFEAWPVRYVLNSGGTAISDADPSSLDWWYFWPGGATGKVRVVGLSSSTFAVVTLDSGDFWIDVYQNFGTSSSFSYLGGAVVGVSSFPGSDAALDWDIVHDPTGNKLWLYYLDAGNNRRLMRTGFDLNTYLAMNNEVEVSATVGASGSTNYAVRVHRGQTSGSQILVCVSNKTSGGNHSTQYVADSFNQAPTAPTLTAKTNYDATAAGTFSWTFNDPNAGDTQSAYQLDINTSAGVDTYDSGKTTSTSSSHNLTGGTLSNPGDWQWRVKTWDAADTEGAWSAYSTFSTAAGGTVTITDPASDNPAGVITDDYTVHWSVASTTQASYRVKLIRTDTSATVSDTGWVTSTDTSYTVTGMVTDVEHRVEVTVRNASNVESATGTRLITPSYGTPEEPSGAASVGDGYVLITVSNPTPTGDRPEVATNQILRRRAGTSGEYELVGTTGLNGTFRDYATASGVTYEYKIRGQA